MMSLNAKNILIGASVIALACGIFFADNPLTQSLVPTEKLSSTPDYFITNINAKEFAENGMIQETLTATQALHYSQESRTLLDNPKVKRHEAAGSWHANGKKGIIEDGSHDILLTDDAVAVKQAIGSPDIILNADNIHYLDSNQSLTSSGNAVLHSTQGKTTATTIVTYINSEEVVMTGSVRGQYETTH
ncbi:LPS export ABC transporter periplasmic protein LptC [Marinomonas pollencensis]|uniref:Lipopolysaccharide export system protein LptC n=1 Tax=Marinomonas pollencensis TaxID=491954 RepID=A0A3E0DGB6_9GAMM|nr:LPS export ABC transporter periplasmic protein LptC [Marinomonas pollencensis]REG81770.1 lipopolysaccharide export system protein LptC [Marinomonas pollencensis]